MKIFLTSIVENAFKRKDEKKIKQLFHFITHTKKKCNIKINEEDIVYVISKYGIYINLLENYYLTRNISNDNIYDSVYFYYNKDENFIKLKNKKTNQFINININHKHNIYHKNQTLYNHYYYVKQKKEKILIDPYHNYHLIKKFLYYSKLYFNSFFHIYFKCLLKETQCNKRNIKNDIYLFHSLCLLNYKEQKQRTKYIFQTIITNIIKTNQYYLNHKRDNKQNINNTNHLFNNAYPLCSNTIVELVTVINKHIDKIEIWGIHIIQLLCLHLFNYIFHSTFFIINWKNGNMKRETNVQVKSDELKNVQVKSDKIKNVQVKNDKIKNVEVKNDKLKIVQVKNDKIKNVQVKSDELKNCQVKNDKLKNVQVKNDKLKICQVKNDELKNVQLNNDKLKNCWVKSFHDVEENPHIHNYTPYDSCFLGNLSNVEIQINKDEETKEININELEVFYNSIFMDISNFVSIVYFLKKYYNNAFFERYKKWKDPIGGDHLMSLIDKKIVYIYSHIYVCNYPLSYLKRCIKWKCLKDKVKEKVKIEDNLEKNLNFTNYNNIENYLNKKNNFLFLQKKEILYCFNKIYSDITYSLYSNTHLLMLKIYISQFDKLLKDTSGKKNFVLFQYNMMIIIKFVNFLSTTFLRQNDDMFYHFNKIIYYHISYCKSLLYLKDQNDKSNHINDMMSVYYQFFEFLLKYYKTFLCTNNLTFLLSFFSDLFRQKGNKMKELKLAVLINEEIINRMKSNSFYMYSDEWDDENVSIVDPICDNNLYNDKLYIDKLYNDKLYMNNKQPHNNYTQSKPFDMRLLNDRLKNIIVNKRHVYNICNSYIQLEYYDERFISLVSEYTQLYLSKLNNKDITAVVYFFYKMKYKNTEIAGNIMTHIERNLIQYNMNEIYIILKCYFELYNFLKKKNLNILSYVFFYIYSCYYIDKFILLDEHYLLCHTSKEKIKKKEKNKKEDILKRSNFLKHHHMDISFYIKELKNLFSCLNYKINILYNEQNKSIEIQNNDHIKYAINEKEINKILLNILMKGEKNKEGKTNIYYYQIYKDKNFIKSILNILFLLSKYKMKKHYMLYDLSYLTFIKHDKYNHMLHVYDWASLITSYSKIKYNVPYIDKYILIFYNILIKQNKKITMNNTNNDPNKNYDTHYSNEHMMRVINSLCCYLKNINLKNKVLIYNLLDKKKNKSM
ncbi:hypothetical protein PGSY75_0932700 [Plasmodium gaboni]|uniref:Uncharacterized protein n=1 Tax=Plasmodium gaboni TaxID=647221 RepID=A0A151LMC8_9APIC|nr:hypothetical protein PGSY75_0932700 [Plasmodium gaboni]KYO00306.1 hypothetical protein PGSY75_0932700 [Plasmodium gaboni]